MRRIREMDWTQRPGLGPLTARLAAPDSIGSTVAWLVAVVLSTVLAYSNTFGASFQFDDIKTIVLNDRVRDLAALWPPSGSRFLGQLSFALNYRFGALDVFGFHVVNVAIHACNALLVFWLVSAILRTPALRVAEAGRLVRSHLPFAASVLFALHPVQTQAVTYVVQRFASLATLFFLLAVASYAQARLSVDADRPARIRAACLYGMSIAASVAALKTKEISFTLPLVIAGYEWLFFRHRTRMVLAIPFFAVAVLAFPLDLVTHGRSVSDALSDPSRLAAETPDISRSTYLLTQSRVVLTYVRLVLLPVRQNLDYDFPLSHSSTEPGVVVAAVLLFALAGAAVFALRRAWSTERAIGVLFFFGVAWFFVTLSVESSLIPIRDVINEHRVYLPSVGAAVALGATLLHVVEYAHFRAPIAVQAAVAVSMTGLPLGAATYARNSVWHDEVTLWSDVVTKSPNKARGHEALGLAYLSRGEIERAIDEFEVALGTNDREAIRRELTTRIGPARARDVARIAALYESSGQLDDAIRAYREATCLDPSSAAAHVNLGTAYHARNRLEEAMAEYREAIRLEPGRAAAHIDLGAAHHAQGRLDEAIGEYRRAIQLDPSVAEAHENLATALEAKGDLRAAQNEHREAERLGRTNEPTRRRIAVP